MIYRIKEGDTYKSISQDIYGKSWLWPVIKYHEYNRGWHEKGLRVGYDLYIPFR